MNDYDALGKRLLAILIMAALFTWVLYSWIWVFTEWAKVQP